MRTRDFLSSVMKLAWQMVKKWLKEMVTQCQKH